MNQDGGKRFQIVDARAGAQFVQHVVSGAATVNPERRGTRMACRYRLDVPAGETVELRLRLVRDGSAETVDLVLDTVFSAPFAQVASPVASVSYGYAAQEPYPYDPARARALLAEAVQQLLGYETHGGIGVVEMEAGRAPATDAAGRATWWCGCAPTTGWRAGVR